MNSFKNIEKFLETKNLNFKKNKIKVSYNFVKHVKIHKEKLIPLGITNIETKEEKINVHYINNLTPIDFNYIYNTEKNAIIITNKNISDFFSGSIIVLHSKSKPKYKTFNIELKPKTLNRKINLLYTEIGYGTYQINLFFPLRENISSQNIFHIFNALTEKFFNIGYIRGFRVRLIFFEYKYLNDISYLIKNFTENTKLNIFIDEGFYTDIIPIVYKYNSKIIINNQFLKKIISIEKKINPKIKFITENSFDIIEGNIEFLWLYPHKAEFNYLLLNKEQLNTISSNIYSLVKFLSKNLIK